MKPQSHHISFSQTDLVSALMGHILCSWTLPPKVLGFKETWCQPWSIKKSIITFYTLFTFTEIHSTQSSLLRACVRTVAIARQPAAWPPSPRLSRSAMAGLHQSYHLLVCDLKASSNYSSTGVGFLSRFWLIIFFLSSLSFLSHNLPIRSKHFSFDC